MQLAFSYWGIFILKRPQPRKKKQKRKIHVDTGVIEYLGYLRNKESFLDIYRDINRGWSRDQIFDYFFFKITTYLLIITKQTNSSSVKITRLFFFRFKIIVCIIFKIGKIYTKNIVVLLLLDLEDFWWEIKVCRFRYVDVGFFYLKKKISITFSCL